MAKALEGHSRTKFTISLDEAASIVTHGLDFRLNTLGKPRRQIPECMHKSGLHSTVISPLVYSFKIGSLDTFSKSKLKLSQKDN